METTYTKGIRKRLGFSSSPCSQKNCKAAETNPELMTNAEWDYYLEKMRLYYKPTENQIIRNAEFRKISQLPNETFSSFCNSVEAAGKSCTISIPPENVRKPLV